MKRLFLFLHLLLATIVAVGQNVQDDMPINLPELYSQIDEAIEQSHHFISQYEENILKTKQTLQQAASDDQRLMTLMELSQMYESFNSDSAQAYTDRAWQLARQAGYKEIEGECLARQAFLCTFLGSQTEALTLLSRVNPDSLDHEALYTYHRAYMTAYSNLAENTKLADMRHEFGELYKQSVNNLLSVAPEGSEMYLGYYEPVLLSEGKLAEALKNNDKRLNMTQPGTHQNAIVCYSRHTIYRMMGDMEKAKYWLCQSALDDVRCATLDQMSLITLAELLDAEGDTERANRYITFTWECNRRFSPHMRSWQIAPLLSAIEQSYQSKLDSKSRILFYWTVAVSVLMLIIAVILFYVNRQRKQMRMMKQELEQNNKELQTANHKLKLMNEWAKKSNEELWAVNKKLTEQ